MYKISHLLKSIIWIFLLEYAVFVWCVCTRAMFADACLSKRICLHGLEGSKSIKVNNQTFVWLEIDAMQLKTTYFIRKTTYSNRKCNVVDHNIRLISYIFKMCLLINIEYSILYHKYVILYATRSILTSKYQIQTSMNFTFL